MFFILVLVFYKRNLPEGASIAKILASRSLLFLADLSLVSPFVYSYFVQLDSFRSLMKTDSSSSTTGYTTPNSTGLQSILDSSRFFLAFLAAGGCFSIHHKYIAPLTFWDGALQFLVLLPSVALAYYAFKRT
jgi:hypothetical protein